MKKDYEVGRKVQVKHKFKELPNSIFVNGVVVTVMKSRIRIKAVFGDGARIFVKQIDDPTLEIIE